LRIYLGNSLPAGQSLLLDDVSFAEFAEDTVQINQLITTYLTVNPTQYSTEDITITEGEDYMGWTASGVYERTLVSTAGCDSLVTTNLTVSSPVVPEPEPEPAPAPAPDPAEPADEQELITEYITICEGEDYLGWTESGVYERVTSTEEISQIITTYLTVTPTQYTTEDITINAGEDYMGWTSSGVYERTLESAAGCDSIVTTNLTVISLAKKPRKKTAVITSLSGWQVPNVNDLVLYPNPARSYINIDYTFQPEDTRIEILDGSGRTLHNQKAESVSNRIDTNHLAPGVYFLRSLQGQQQKVIKFIIQ
jgi:hypothetical protein